MKSLKNITIVFSSFISCILLLYLISTDTFTSYESETSNLIKTPVAMWNIKLDDTVATDVFNKNILLRNISLVNPHANPSKIAPGTQGTLKVLIDPTTTQVAIKYNLTFIDHNVDPQHLLTVKNVSVNDNSLIKTASNTYTGLFTLNEIERLVKKEVTLSVEWINKETNNNADTIIGKEEAEPKWLSLSFNASQYNNEVITEYK